MGLEGCMARPISPIRLIKECYFSAANLTLSKTMKSPGLTFS